MYTAASLSLISGAMTSSTRPSSTSGWILFGIFISAPELDKGY
jgi:hypothetical protein